MIVQQKSTMQKMRVSLLNVVVAAVSFAAMFNTAHAQNKDHAISNNPHKKWHQEFGRPIPEELATRTIEVQSDTKWINVTRGEAIKIVWGKKTMAWNFDTVRSTLTLDLKLISPADWAPLQIIVYVGKRPDDRG